MRGDIAAEGDEAAKVLMERVSVLKAALQALCSSEGQFRSLLQPPERCGWESMPEFDEGSLAMVLEVTFKDSIRKVTDKP